jgi:hypothetical protein
MAQSMSDYSGRETLKIKEQDIVDFWCDTEPTAIASRLRESITLGHHIFAYKNRKV